jgi:hypothetical protein
MLSISRSSNTVSATFKGPHNFTVGDPVLIRGVSNSSFNGTFLLTAVIDSTHVRWNQAGLSATSSGGTLDGPGDRATAPADRHTYHLIAWDSKRNALWTGFGSAEVGGTSANCPDCGISDFYKLDLNSPAKWTELCGFGSTACPRGALQEGAGTYDPQADAVVVYGGLIRGSPVADTWIYWPALNTWKEVCGQENGLSPCGPPALHDHSMVAIGQGKIVMFGGVDQKLNVQNQTWVFDTAKPAWTRVSSTAAPSAQKFPLMDWVPKLNRLVLIGAESTGAQVWALDPVAGQWQNLNIAVGPTLNENPGDNQGFNTNLGGYDPHSDRFVLFKAGTMNGTTQIWQLVLPSSVNLSSATAVAAANDAAQGESSQGSVATDGGPQGSAQSSCATLNMPLNIQEALPPGVQGVARTPGIVTVGLPLADCQAITSVSQLGLSGVYAGQFRILGRWPSGNAKWVQVDTVVNTVADEKNTSVTFLGGGGNFGGSNLANDNGASILISTGSAAFTIRKAKFDLFDQVVVNGANLVQPGTSTGLVLVGPSPGSTVCPCATLYSSSNDSTSTAVVEENGPVRAVVKATGQLKNSAGNAYMRYTVRMQFYAGRSDVKAEVILQNADYGTSNTFATAFKGFSAFEARVAPTLPGTKSFSFGTSSTPARGSFTGQENAYLYQAHSNSMESCQWITPPDPRYDPRSYIGRTLTTQSGCQSVWSYSQDGYQVKQGNAMLASGGRTQYPEGWADLASSSGAGVEVGIYQLAAYWPKSLQFMNGGTEVRVGIWPDQSLYGSGGQQYIQPWPQYSLHTLYFNFHSHALSAPDDEFTKFQYPLIARASLATYNNAQVFPVPILDPSEADNFYKSLGMGCCIADKSPSIHRAYAWSAPGGGNQAEMRWSDLLLWLQRGYTGRYLDAAHFYTFQTEQVFPRSDDYGSTPFHWRDSFVPPAELATNGVPGNINSLNNNLNCDVGANKCGRNWMEPAAEHAHWYGMIDYYFMTGNEAVKDAVQDGPTDEFGNPKITYIANKSYANTRAVGAALMSAERLHNFYAATGDNATASAVFTAGDAIITGQIFPNLTLSGYGSSPIKGVSRTRGVASEAQDLDGADRVYDPLMQGILNEGLWEYLQEHGTGWTNYQNTFDLAEGIASSVIKESFVQTGLKDTGCTTGAGLPYEVYMDKANAASFHPTCGQTVWFNFFNAAKYGDSNVPWASVFEAHLKHVDKNSMPGKWAEYGTVFVEAAINEILHPEPTKLVDVPLQVTNKGNGSYLLSWTVPVGAQKYLFKYSDKKIVEWLNFNPATNTFGISPATNVPWFAASNPTGAPAPASGGTVQTYTVTGLDPTKIWQFALKAYVPAK